MGERRGALYESQAAHYDGKSRQPINTERILKSDVRHVSLMQGTTLHNLKSFET